MAYAIPSGEFADDVPQGVSTFERFTVYQKTAPGAGTPKVQISGDGGTTWHDVAAFGAGGFLTVTDLATHARVHGGSGAAGVYSLRGLYSHESG